MFDIKENSEVLFEGVLSYSENLMRSDVATIAQTMCDFVNQLSYSNSSSVMHTAVLGKISLSTTAPPDTFTEDSSTLSCVSLPCGTIVVGGIETFRHVYVLYSR